MELDCAIEHEGATHLVASGRCFNIGSDLKRRSTPGNGANIHCARDAYFLKSRIDFGLGGDGALLLRIACFAEQLAGSIA